MKKIVCDDGRVFVNWKAFRIREFVNLLRCQMLCLRPYDAGV